jgi:hypothetical protein
VRRLLACAALLVVLVACEDEPDPECERSQKVALTSISGGSDIDMVRATFELYAPEDCDWPL